MVPVDCIQLARGCCRSPRPGEPLIRFDRIPKVMSLLRRVLGADYGGEGADSTINRNYFASLKTLIITRKRITSKDILPGTT